jgi:teichoic acid transport system ATP-binding protein
MAKASTAVADLAQDLAQRLAQDLAQDEVEPAPRIRPPRELGRPTVVVDDVHITYRIIGAGGKGGTKIGLPTPAAAVRRLVTRKPSSVKVREIKAVKGVSFIARQGEAIGLLGSNGSGKSTLLRAIAGLLPVNAGAVYTMGQPSLLGANAALLTELSGEENVIIGLLAMGMSREEAEEMMPSIIEFSGINEHGDNFGELPMSTYSSGMSARLRFSIAAAKLHEVLLVDEALATGDARFRRRSEERVRELLSGAGTIFLVSHAVGTIQEVCERSIWLERGLIRMDGPTEEVVAAYEEFMAR